jgi:APOBEC-like N-terminal domain
MSRPSTASSESRQIAGRLRFVTSTRDGALNYLRGIEKNSLIDKEVWAMVCFDGLPETVEVFWSEQGARSPRYGGRHAEHVLCENFPDLVARFTRIPWRVSLYLSRSPCHANHPDPSVACLIRGARYGEGCSAKLAALIRENPKVESWRIRYDEVFARGGAGGRAPSEQGLRELSALSDVANPNTMGGRYNVDVAEFRPGQDVVLSPFWD